MPLMNGALAAGFRIIQLIGTGGMGEVYLAQHPRLPRQDALKILPTDVSADPEFRERFSREADVAAGLWHPHIVGLHDRGEFEGRLWISMDYVDGSDAAQLLRHNYPTGMPPAEVVEIISAIAEALDYAHERGLLHRDVKPGNILLTEPTSQKRRILLADFGVARHIDDVNGLTRTNTAVGTVDYAAPEQLTGGQLDECADQYALAATAFHLLTGAPPFQNSNPAVVIGKHLNEPPPRLREVRPELAGFDAALSRALAKDPADRFPRCQDFANALRAGHDQPPSTTEAADAAAATRHAATWQAPAAAGADTGAATQQAPAASAPARLPAPVAPAQPLAPPPRRTAAGPPASPAPAAATPAKRRTRHPILKAFVMILVLLTLVVIGVVILMSVLTHGGHAPSPSITPSPPTTSPYAPSPSVTPETTTPSETSTPETTTPSSPATTTPSSPATTTPSSPATTTPSSPATTTPSSPATTTPSSSAMTPLPGITIPAPPAATVPTVVVPPTAHLP